jgi:hypothetical protein
MKAPKRLREGEGPARELMKGSGLRVPSASRRRALAFTGAAATMAASGTAAAASVTALAKGVVVWIGLGTIGGGLMSLAVSKTIAHVETTRAPVARGAANSAGPSARVASMTPPSATEAAPLVAPPAAEPPAAADVLPVVPSAVTPAPAAVAAPAAIASSGKRRAAPSLFAEQGIIESARAALARGDAAFALSILDGYQRTHAQGQFGPEALALRIEALSSRGDLARARALTADFRQRYPHHPLLRRVEVAAGH